MDCTPGIYRKMKGKGVERSKGTAMITRTLVPTTDG